MTTVLTRQVTRVAAVVCVFPEGAEDRTMPRYMLQFSYTPQAWAALAKNPANRRQLVEGMMQKLGGRLVDLYYHFGDFDGTAIVEAPDDTTAVAAVIAAVTPGHIKTTRTTRLMTVEETIEAMKKAGTVSLPAPG